MSAELFRLFYEMYPVEDFETDSDRSEALGYFMAGVAIGKRITEEESK